MHFLLKIYSFLVGKSDASDDEKKAYLDSLSEPRDDLDRAYFNYRCSVYGQKPLGIFIMNFAGFLAIPLFWVLYLFNLLLVKKEPKTAFLINSKNRAGDAYNYAGRIPEELQKEFPDLEEMHLDAFPRFSEGVLDAKAWGLWFRFFLRHPFSGFINFRSLVNLAGFNKLLKKYQPKMIATARAELNGCSSLISCLCEKKGAEFVNLMHGEVMTNPVYAFVRFSRFYLWDAHYTEIFRWARAAEGQYRVFFPDIYKKQLAADAKINYFMNYILTGDERTRLDRNIMEVRRVLTELVKQGKKCKVRPHPRWSDYQKVCEVFQDTGIDVENPREIRTDASIAESEYIAGTFSTVLTEAFYFGKPVVLDDVTDQNVFLSMQKRMYFLLSQKHRLLSEFCKNDIGEEG